MCMDMPGNIVHGAAVTVNIFGTDDAHIHIAGHDITSEQLVAAWNAANPKKEKIYAY